MKKRDLIINGFNHEDSKESGLGFKNVLESSKAYFEFLGKMEKDFPINEDTDKKWTKEEIFTPFIVKQIFNFLKTKADGDSIKYNKIFEVTKGIIDIVKEDFGIELGIKDVVELLEYSAQLNIMIKESVDGMIFARIEEEKRLNQKMKSLTTGRSTIDPLVKAREIESIKSQLEGLKAIKKDLESRLV